MKTQTSNAFLTQPLYLLSQGFTCDDCKGPLCGIYMISFLIIYPVNTCDGIQTCQVCPSVLALRDPFDQSGIRVNSTHPRSLLCLSVSNCMVVV